MSSDLFRHLLAVAVIVLCFAKCHCVGASFDNYSNTIQQVRWSLVMLNKRERGRGHEST